MIYENINRRHIILKYRKQSNLDYKNIKTGNEDKNSCLNNLICHTKSMLV